MMLYVSQQSSTPQSSAMDKKNDRQTKKTDFTTSGNCSGNLFFVAL
jgi:hypothetical protein